MYDTAYPYYGEEPEHAHEIEPQPSFYVLSESVYHAFVQRYSLNEIHDYEKLRKVASLQDMAQLELLRDRLLQNKPQEGYRWGATPWGLTSPIVGVENFHPRLSEDQRRELDQVRQYLVADPRLIQEMASLYWAVKDPEQCEVICDASARSKAPDLPYEVIKGPSSIYIVVREGCFTFIEPKPARLAFLVQVLKAAYTLYPISQVNRTQWYNEYVSVLLRNASSS